MHELIDIFLHLDKHLQEIAGQYGAWVYGLLFLIVFCETGLVVTPFLPGDSLLFAVGALVGIDVLHPAVIPLLLVAAVLGNTSNYWIGKRIGPRIFRHEDSEAAGRERAPLLVRLLNKKHLAKAHKFFEKHGGKAVILGQFLPIIRTFVPFVAGAGVMTYRKFVVFNVTGAVAWVGICCGAGRLFGSRQVVKDNFSLVVLGIIGVSLIPVAVQVVRGWMGPRSART